MALMSVKLGTGAVTHLWERRRMDKRDKEIEQERERERANELALHNQPTTNTTIEHFTHPHPLHRAYMSSPFLCGSCHVSSASGWAYTCGVPGCAYFLHVVCSGGQATLQPAMASAIGKAPHHHPHSEACVTTFAHRKDHPVKDVYSIQAFRCDHCFTNGKGRRFKCEDCDVNLHPVCARHPTRLSTFLHPQHELELKTKHRFRRCKICCHSLKSGQKGLNLRVYGCEECHFRVHPTCSQLPQYLLHELHPVTDPPHTLQLKPAEPNKSSKKCDACSSDCTTGWQYVCTICSVSFHIQCILQHSIKDKNKDNSYKGSLANMIELFSTLIDVSNVANSLF